MNSSPKALSEKGGENKQNRERFLRILALLLVVAIILVAFFFRERLSHVREMLGAFAYGGLFIVDFLATASVVVPLPGAVAVVFAGSILSPFLVGLVAGVAEALGETVGYLLGFSGRGVVENRQFYQRAVEWVRRRGWLVFLIFSTVPNPFFDIVGIVAGGLRYPIWRFLLIVWVGKTVKSLILAYAGYLGLASLLKLLPFD